MFSKSSVKNEQRSCQTLAAIKAASSNVLKDVVNIRTIEVFSEQMIQSTRCVCLPNNCPVARHQLRTLCKLMSDILDKLDMH